MKIVRNAEVKENTSEELLPGFSPEFPYICTLAELDAYQVPWHWHKTVELFYIQSGILEYTTPHGSWVFPAGSGGLLNADVLHRSAVHASGSPTIQLLHLFDPSFLSGAPGSRMEKKYILPLTVSSGIEMLPLHPEIPAQKDILEDIKRIFELSEEEWGYEFHLRESLVQVWLKLLEQAGPMLNKGASNAGDEKLKSMMIYVHEHYREPITIDQLARSVHVSRRVCFRLFQQNLHMSPLQYMQSYRLQKARHLLQTTAESITAIAHSCGLGTSSYFSRIFRKEFGVSPREYRK
ncbi:MAG: helix-turn-helix domain-containing protein [Clostridia bacterium]|nr:helix-turn-helix domain-containing protein [Clostridia bacterium]